MGTYSRPRTDVPTASLPGPRYEGPPAIPSKIVSPSLCAYSSYTVSSLQLVKGVFKRHSPGNLAPAPKLLR